jgi:hypothetical protein
MTGCPCGSTWPMVARRPFFRKLTGDGRVNADETSVASQARSHRSTGAQRLATA